MCKYNNVFSFPTFGLQGGGVGAFDSDNNLIFIFPPDGYEMGETVPSEWSWVNTNWGIGDNGLSVEKVLSSPKDCCGHCKEFFQNTCNCPLTASAPVHEGCEHQYSKVGFNHSICLFYKR